MFILASFLLLCVATLDEAKSKATRAQITSEVDDTDGDYSQMKRICKQPSRFSNSSSSDSNEPNAKRELTII